MPSQALKKNDHIALVEPSDNLVRATHGDNDHPLKIGSLEIPCYVLEDKRRVIVQSGMFRALDMSQGTATAKSTGDRLSRFIATKGVREFVSPELAKVITEPIKFRSPSGSVAYGYEATVLADLCNSVLDAREKGRLNYQQEHIADQCQILVRAFAKVGIVALVDEATGYQFDRARDALADILTTFLRNELAKWVKTFPDEFYRELFRLRGLSYSQFTTKRPVIIGKLTNDIIYERLAPGVLEELKRKTPKTDKGYRKNKFHQWLTEDVGHPALREHLAGVVMLMKASANWPTFYRLLQRAKPKWSEQLQDRLLDVAED